MDKPLPISTIQTKKLMNQFFIIGVAILFSLPFVQKNATLSSSIFLSQFFIAFSCVRKEKVLIREAYNFK